MNRRLLHLIVTKSLGCLLLVAAALKIYGFGTTPVGPIGIFSSPSFQVGLIEFEILLGIWLLSGKAPIGSWIVAIAGFASFAAVSFYLGWIGQASCGCFGKLSVSPWYAFGIDLASVLGFVLARPDLSRIRANFVVGLSHWSLMVVHVLLIAGILLGFLLAYAHYGVGSTGKAIALLRNEAVSVRPTIVDAGSGPSGKSVQIVFDVVNCTDHPIKIIGGTSDCSCHLAGDLPFTLYPGEVRALSARLTYRGPPGLFTRTARLFTDDPVQPFVVVRVVGRILAAEDAAARRRGESSVAVILPSRRSVGNCGSSTPFSCSST